MSRVHWTSQEEDQVATEFIRRFPSHIPTASKIADSQVVLPADRHRKAFIGVFLQRFRERVGHLKAHTSGMPALTHACPPSLMPALPATNGHDAVAHVALGTDEEVVNHISGVLLEINKRVLQLKALTGAELQRATRDPLDHERIKNLTVTANDGITFFEELLQVASKH